MKSLLIALVVVFGLTSTSLAAKVHASWYGPGFHGNRTASGEIFDQNDYTAAHKTLPFGTIVKITYNGKTVKVRINDRGPYIKGRVIDLSKAAAKKIGCPGVCVVDMTIQD